MALHAFCAGWICLAFHSPLLQFGGDARLLTPAYRAQQRYQATKRIEWNGRFFAGTGTTVYKWNILEKNRFTSELHSGTVRVDDMDSFVCPGAVPERGLL